MLGIFRKWLSYWENVLLSDEMNWKELLHLGRTGCAVSKVFGFMSKVATFAKFVLSELSSLVGQS